MERLRRDPHYQHLMLIGAGLGMLALFLFYAEGNLNGYRLQLVTLVAINIVIAVALTMSNGFTGVFSLGQMGFVAIGAYAGWKQLRAPSNARVADTLVAVREMSWSDFSNALEDAFERDATPSLGRALPRPTSR